MSPVGKRKVKAWGCGFGLIVFVVAVALLAREILLRYSPEPPRRAITPLPRTKPPGVERWDNEAAQLLEQNARTLQSARTLAVEYEFFDTFQEERHVLRQDKLLYARPNRARIEHRWSGGSTSLKIADGWLECALSGDSAGRFYYSYGISFADGRSMSDLSDNPSHGFFPPGNSSYLEQVRQLLQHHQLRALTVEQGTLGKWVRVETKGYQKWICLDSQALPIWAETHSWTFTRQPRYEWFPLRLPRWGNFAYGYRVHSLKLDEAVPADAFAIKIPLGAKPYPDTARFEKLAAAFMTLRGWALPE